MRSEILHPSNNEVRSNVLYVLSTLENKYGFKANWNDLPPIMKNPAPGRLKYLVLVTPKITSGRIVEAEHIELLIDLDRVLDFSKYQFVLPPRNVLGYWLWMSAGELYRDRAPGDIEQYMGQHERGGMMCEGLHLFTQYGNRDDLANLDKGKPFMYFAGSRCEDGSVPCVCIWNGGPRLSANYSGFAVPSFGSASAGVFLGS